MALHFVERANDKRPNKCKPSSQAPIFSNAEKKSRKSNAKEKGCGANALVKNIYTMVQLYSSLCFIYSSTQFNFMWAFSMLSMQAASAMASMIANCRFQFVG